MTTFSLPISGTEPRFSTVQALDSEVNRVLKEVTDARIAGDDANSEGAYYAGVWDASSGSFPTIRGNGGAVQQGDYFDVSVAGTHAGEDFLVGERIKALVPTPSESTLAGNWYYASSNAMLAPISLRVENLETILYQTRDQETADRVAILPNGTIFRVAGLEYERDDSVLIWDSAFNQFNVAGVKPYGVSSPEHYGANENDADNSSELNRMYSQNPKAVRYDKFYPVTGNFTRLSIPHYGAGGVTIGGVNIPLSTTETLQQDITCYVSTSGSDVSNHGLSAAFPFATEGMARKFLPQKLGTGVTYLTSVANGVYDDSAIAASEMYRSALIYVSGLSSDRSSVIDGNLKGGYVVKGESKTGTIFRVGANSYKYGAYATQASNLGIQDLTIDTSAACNALATAHRSSYLQTLNVDITGGTNAAQCVVAESGGVVECTGDGDLTGAGTTILALDESLVTLANDGSASGGSSSVLAGRGTIYINNTFSLVGNCAAEGTRVILRGSDASNRVSCGLIGSIRDGHINATYANITGLLTCYNSGVDLNAVSHSERIIMKGGSINRRSGSTTGTPSTHDNPIVLHFGAKSTSDGSCVYMGATGATAPTVEPYTLNVTGNDQTLSVVDYTNHFRITGVSANRTGFQISSNGVVEGRVIYIDGDTWNVSFATGGSHMDVSTVFGLGISSGFYTGATFQMRAGKWRCVGLGASR